MATKRGGEEPDRPGVMDPPGGQDAPGELNGRRELEAGGELETRLLEGRVKQLRDLGVETVRITYSDIHGIARGKELPLREFIRAAREGLGFCSANLADGLAFSLAQLSERIAGGPVDTSFPDMHVQLLPSTLAPMPWDSSMAWCLARVDPSDRHSAYASRNVLERAVAEYRAIGVSPQCAAEFEFYLLKREAAGFTRYTDHFSMIYTMGERSDPQGLLREMARVGREAGLDLTAVHHECGRGQFEINLNHGDALQAADRAFRFKDMVKELAARRGLHATFMGKPFADDAGSGLHLHVSASNADGNAFHDPQSSDGLSGLARHFLAGVMAHAPALMAFASPTVNSYKRIVPGTLVPTSVTWGYDDRTAYIRVPPDRGEATRLELRAADAAANPYLVVAANLCAGLDGIRRRLDPPPPTPGGGALAGIPLPTTLEASLDALKADAALGAMLGRPLVDAFAALKTVEAERFRRAVTDWELSEYIWHL
jgi:glutamine synthetase